MLGGGQLLQAKSWGVEEQATASKQFLLHGWQAAPLLNEPQHLQGGGMTSHFIFNFKLKQKLLEPSSSTQIDSLDIGASLKSKTCFTFSIFKIHLNCKQTI